MDQTVYETSNQRRYAIQLVSIHSNPQADEFVVYFTIRHQTSDTIIHFYQAVTQPLLDCWKLQHDEELRDKELADVGRLNLLNFLEQDDGVPMETPERIHSLKLTTKDNDHDLAAYKAGLKRRLEQTRDNATTVVGFTL